MTHVEVAIATQELIMSGWFFIVMEAKGKREIREAHHVSGRGFAFESEEDFLNWLEKMEKEIRGK